MLQRLELEMTSKDLSHSFYQQGSDESSLRFILLLFVKNMPVDVIIAFVITLLVFI